MKKLLIIPLLILCFFARAQTGYYSATMQFGTLQPGVSILDSVRYYSNGQYSGVAYLWNSAKIRNYVATHGGATTWSSITGKPTTLSGYGITDAYPLTGNPSAFLTSFTETDPTVPAYAKTLAAFSVIKTSTDALYGTLTQQNTNTSNIATNTTAISANTSAIALKANSLIPTAVKTSAYTIAVNDYVPTNSTSGTVSLTLPTAPANYSLVGVKMVIQGSTNTTTITTGGTDVFNKTGGSTVATLSLVNQAILLEYYSGIWYVLSDDLPLPQLDLRYVSGGGTTNYISKYTGSNTLGISSIYDNGTFVSVQNPLNILPLSSAATPTAIPSPSSGTIPAGTYYYEYVPVDNAGNLGLPSPEVSATTTGSTSSVALTWSTLSGSQYYRIYRGTSPGGENIYFISNSSSFTDINGGAVSGSLPSINTAAIFNVNSTGAIFSGLNTGTVLTLGYAGTSALSTSSPVSIDLGNTYSSVAGSNLKIKLLSTAYGFGVSNSSLDYVGLSHSFYSGSTKILTINPTSTTSPNPFICNVLSTSATTPLFSYNGSTGWGITAGKLNYIATVSTDHDFYLNGTVFLEINQSKSLLIGTTTNIPSSIVTVSSTTQGMLPPRMTTAQKNAISSPSDGLVVYDTTLEALCTYNNTTTSWVTLGSGGGGLSTSNFVRNEIPTGSINGSNPTFTLLNTPSSSVTVEIWYNGVKQTYTSGTPTGIQYSISGSTVTMGTAPTSGIITADYLK